MFICFEGVDGAGKSTQARLLHERFAAAERPVALVADPGTTGIGIAIRQLILDTDEEISAAAQMLLFSAARAELSSFITTQLAAGFNVICDRWLLSTLVYQGVINKIDPKLIVDIFNKTCVVRPDLYVVLDLPANQIGARLTVPTDRYEAVCLQLKNEMRQSYLKYAASVEEPVLVVDATLPEDAVHQKIVDAIEQRFNCFSSAVYPLSSAIGG